MEKILTEYVHPPIPDRRWDWRAAFENYEPGDLMGWGASEADAIEDLEQQYLHEEEERKMI